MCTLFLYCVNILCMYAMYVYYAWHVYYHVYVYCSSVHLSIHVCFVRILCMCAGYVSVYVYYICLPYIPCTCIPSKCVHPPVHPCICALCVCYICILCMYLGVIRYIYAMYVYGVCTVCMGWMLLYPFVRPSIHSSMHVSFILKKVYTMYV